MTLLDSGRADDEGALSAGGRRLAVLLAAATLGVYVLFVLVAAQHTHNRIGLGGTPLFYDFSCFYQAGQFADHGQAANAYDDATMIGAEQAAFPGSTLRLPWNYPPSFQLLFMPLAALPYVPAWLIWSGATYGLYALLARRLVQPRQLWILLLAPGAAVNLFFGQNGLLSTTLMGAGVLLLKRRPILGGALLGLLTYKPTFALLVPLVLVSGREWRALAGAVACGAAMALLALAVLGPAPTLAFLHKALQPAAVLSSSSSDWRAVPSVMTLARTLGLNPSVSSACHWIVAAAAAIGALWTWARTRDLRLRAAALATATLLVTPYLRTYDLALLILPIAWLLAGPAGGRRVGERAMVVAAWSLPGLLMLMTPTVQFGPLVAMGLMGLILRRVAHYPPAPFDGGSAPRASPPPRPGSRPGWPHRR